MFKLRKMKNTKNINIIILVIGFLFITSCELDGGESLNGASTTSISDDLSKGELQQAMPGVLSDMRVRINTQIDVQSIFGREYYYITSSDPRFEADVVTAKLDDNTFYTTSPWGSRYATVKDINLMLSGLGKTTADFSTAEIGATRGVLNTLKAHELLMVSNNQFQNGVRIDVINPDELGSIVGYDEALVAIFSLLTEAAADLGSAADLDLSSLFPLTSGYDALRKKDPSDPAKLLPLTAADFIEFNKALSARVEAYRGNYPNVLSLLSDSFMDMSAGLGKGIYHTFSLAGNDQANPLFIALNQTANVRVAHLSFTADAEVGDTRVGKVVQRDTQFETDDTGIGTLVGTHDVWINQSNLDGVPLMRNEELILLFAEANITASPADAVMALNIIRNAAGLANYSGAQTPEALTDEMLKQRRYSLFGEGHRWIDMRRFGRLDQLPNDRPGDKVAEQVPIPANENQ